MSSTTTNLGLTKPAGNELIDLDIINGNMDILDAAVGSIADVIYPIGSIYMSVNSTSPATLFGGTWEQIEDTFLLAAGSSYSAGSTGGEAEHTLTSAESGLPAHVHGLNSHKHSVGAHKHTVPQHGHGNNISYSVNSSGYVANGIPSAGSHHHKYWFAQLGSGISPSNNGSMMGFHMDHYWERDGNDILDAGSHTHNLPNHTHTLTKSGGVSDKAAFDTNNNTAFDSGAASGDTASNTAADASAAHNNMPPFLSVYVWKRTA